MKQTPLLVSILMATLLVAAGVRPAAAGDFAKSTVTLTKPALTVGLAACLLGDEEHGAERAIRATDAVTVSVGIAQVVKSGTDLWTGSKYHHGFPSGHAAAAFAMATSLSEAHPKQKWLYYAGAAVMSWGLVRSGNHTWLDVAGGAGLGIGVSRLSNRHPNGLLISKMLRF